jgi:Flp pilus assembly protein CpaB
MNTARIVILTIALSAGGVAAYLMRGYDDNKPLPAEPVSVKPDDLQWQTWPAAIASNSFIRRGDRAAGGFILTDIRDLAIDQAPKQKDRTNSLVGKIALLELRPEQSETLAHARQSGALSLALRSITDVNTVESRSEEHAPNRGESVNVARYGVASQMTTQKWPKGRSI